MRKKTRTMRTTSSEVSNQITPHEFNSNSVLVNNSVDIITPQKPKKRIIRTKKQIEEGITLDDLKRTRLF